MALCEVETVERSLVWPDLRVLLFLKSLTGTFGLRFAQRNGCHWPTLQSLHLRFLFRSFWDLCDG
jgi:hypothetical protein